jgi:hypothetical protein
VTVSDANRNVLGGSDGGAVRIGGPALRMRMRVGPVAAHPEPRVVRVMRHGRGRKQLTRFCADHEETRLESVDRL